MIGMFLFLPVPISCLSTKMQTTTGTEPVNLQAYAYFCLYFRMVHANKQLKQQLRMFCVQLCLTVFPGLLGLHFTHHFLCKHNASLPS